MKKFRAIATQKKEIPGQKKLPAKYVYRSVSFTFRAPNFERAFRFAEKYAKGMMVFHSLKVSEL